MNVQNHDMPPTIKKAIEQSRLAQGAGLIFGALAFLGIGGQKTREIAQQAKDIVRQTEELMALPDEFNSRFQSLGWLISESTNVEVAKEAILLFDDGKSDEAEAHLCTLFESDNLDFMVMRLRSIKAFRPRNELARSAVLLSQAGQYAGAVPLILTIIDGTASDALGKSIYAEGIDVSEVKALAGSAECFPQLIAEVSRVRRRTNEDELRFPYRNGIIHGKDTNFGNRLVTAKCWSILSCFGDILRARDAIEEIEDKRGFWESVRDYGEIQKDRQHLDEWKPRALISITGDGQFEAQNFAADTPEHALCLFLGYWKDQNFGKIGDLTVYHDNRPTGKRAGEIRQDLEEFRFLDAQILRIEDHASAVTEIAVQVEYRVQEQDRADEYIFRLIYFDEEMDILARHREGGRWLVMPAYQGWVIRKRLSHVAQDFPPDSS